ncbi:hypothetical protein BsWGS_08109 [Bradybaena similaris]
MTLKRFGFGAADIYLPKNTMRLSYITAAGLMIFSLLSLALEEATMLRGSGEVHRNALSASHRPSNCRSHFLDLWPSFRCDLSHTALYVFMIFLRHYASPLPFSMSSFTITSMSTVAQGPTECVMLGHIASWLQLGHIIKCNQAIIQHSTYRVAVSFMGFRCFIVNRLQHNAQRTL